MLFLIVLIDTKKKISLKTLFVDCCYDRHSQTLFGSTSTGTLQSSFIWQHSCGTARVKTKL